MTTENLLDYKIQVEATKGEQLVVLRLYQASPDNWVVSDKYLTHNLAVLPSLKKRRPWMEQVPVLFKTTEVQRCEVCNFPLAATADDGCVPGNCSYRPHPHTADWYRIQERKRQLRCQNEQPEQLTTVSVASSNRTMCSADIGQPTTIEQLEQLAHQGVPVVIEPSGVARVVPRNCPACGAHGRGVCVHPWHWNEPGALGLNECPDCHSQRPEGFISFDSVGRHECQHKYHNPYNLTAEQILPSTY